jgi:hypothetical protein
MLERSRREFSLPERTEPERVGEKVVKAVAFNICRKGTAASDIFSKLLVDLSMACGVYRNAKVLNPHKRSFEHLNVVFLVSKTS